MRRIVAVFILSILTACIGDHHPDRSFLPIPGFGGQSDSMFPGGPGGPTKANIQLRLTDKKIEGFEVVRVSVRFSRIELKEKGEDWTTIVDFGPSGKEFDLMKLTDGNTADLAVFALDPGTYKQVRLHVMPDNEIEIIDKGKHEVLPLKIPSGGETGIKLKGPFTIPTAGNYALTVDFDAEKSIKCMHKKCRLKPVIKIIAPEAMGVTQKPTLNMPPGLDIPPEAFTVTESDIVLPQKIGMHYVPVSDVYEIGLDYPKILATNPDMPVGSIVFPGVKPEVRIKYNAAELARLGFTDDFVLWYFDSASGRWVPADNTRVDAASQTVIATVSHMTPYVLTALPKNPLNTTRVVDPPACLAADMGTINLSSSVPGWTPRFTVIDSYFKYLQDRDYLFDNPAMIQAMGFEQALAIATCNGGGDNSCGTIPNHKQYTGANYLTFTAHTNIDVYVMYDTRGMADPTDNSQDAPWLRNPVNGWTLLAGQYIHTTDVMGNFRIYKKAFNQGQLVALHGNRQGVVVPGIDTNYWVVIKRQGVTTSQPASTMCEAQPDPNAPAAVSNLSAAPGVTQAIITWLNPADSDFAGTVIRRGPTPPLTPTDGVAPGGAKASNQSWVDTSLFGATTYCYSVFAVDSNNNYSPPRSTCVTTGATGEDGEPDGLTTGYELSKDWSLVFGGPGPRLTSDGAADSDGDGFSDVLEIAQGTDPTIDDAAPPNVTVFALTSPNPTTNPVVTFNLNGTDDKGITHWLISENNTQPSSLDPRWQAVKPTSYTLIATGNYNLYAWAKDGGQNVSPVFAPVAVNLEGMKVPKWLYVTRGWGPFAVETYAMHETSGQLTFRQSVPMDDHSWYNAMAIHPSGSFMYVTTYNRSELLSFRIDPLTGMLSVIARFSLPAYPNTVVASPDGRALMVGTDAGYQLYSIDESTGIPQLRGALKPGDADSGYSLAFSGDSRYVFAGLFGTEGIRTLMVDTVAYTFAPSSLSAGWAYFSIRLNPGIPVLYVDRRDYEHPTALAYDTTTGLVTTLQQWGRYGGGKLGALAIDPQGQFLFSGRSAVAGSIDTYRIKGDGTLETASKLANVGWVQQCAEVDPSGTYLTAPDMVSSSLTIYGIDRASGSLTALSRLSDVTCATSLSTHDANDPPVANPGPGRWIQFGLPVALNGIGSFDPDATRCAANPANYQYTWDLDPTPGSIPLGSALTNASIVNPNSLTNAMFTPDVPGEYRVRLSFRDDPGTCNGTAKTRSTIVRIKSGFQHWQTQQCNGCVASTYPPSRPGSIPSDAVFQEDWSFHKTEEIGTYRGYYVACDPWGIVKPACWVAIGCDYHDITYSEGLKQCAAHSRYVPYLEQWIPEAMRVTWAGSWGWWAYTP